MKDEERGLVICSPPLGGVARERPPGWYKGGHTED
jgi:hypothetical protein